MTVVTASFGERCSAVTYRGRASAYAVVISPEFRIAAARESGRFYLPGGAIEPGETAIEAVTREAREECGADLTVHAVFCRADQFLSVPGEGHFHIDATIFSGEFGREAQAAAGNTLHWLEASEALGMMTREFERWAVAVAMNGPL